MSNAIGQRSTVEGHWEIEVHRRGLGVVAKREFHNLITDAGLDQLGTMTFANVTAVVHVGTGTVAPSVTDTTLAGPLAGSTGRRASPDVTHLWADYTSESPPRIQYDRISVYQFPVGQVVGNLSEIGVGPGSVSSPESLFSRALILDSNGDPTTVTATADDIVVCRYTLRINWTASSSGTVTVGGVDYDYDTIIEGGSGNRTAPINTFSVQYGQYLTTMAPWSGPEHSYSWSGSNTLTSEALLAYTPGTHYRDCRITYPAGTVSSGYQGIRVVAGAISGSSRSIPWWIRFHSQIPVSSVQVFRITQRASWGRA
jgi:hypothetical protein